MGFFEAFEGFRGFLKRRSRQKRERSHKFPEGVATEGAKKRKVTQFSGRHSDGGAKKEKGHAYFWKAKRQRRKKRKRSRSFPEDIATEVRKKRKVTLVSGRQSDRGAKKRERSHKFPEDIATEEQKKRKVTHVSGRRSDGGAKKEKGHAFFRKA